MVTVSLQEKNGFYHAVVNYKDDNGKRKQKWFSTKLKIRGKGICGHDYYIVVNPKFPNKLSPKEKKLIKEFKSEENGN